MSRTKKTKAERLPQRAQIIFPFKRCSRALRYFSIRVRSTDDARGIFEF